MDDIIREGADASEIAEACGVKKPTVYKWLSGERSIPKEHREVIEEILGEDKARLLFSARPAIGSGRVADPARALKTAHRVLARSSDIEDQELAKLIGRRIGK